MLVCSFWVFLSFLFFPKFKWLLWNFTFGSWFDLYARCCYFHVDGDNVFMFVSRSIFFRYLQQSIISISYWKLTLVAHISVNKWEPVGMYDSDCFLRRQDSVIERYAFRRGADLKILSTIWTLLVYEYSI